MPALILSASKRSPGPALKYWRIVSASTRRLPSTTSSVAPGAAEATTGAKPITHTQRAEEQARRDQPSSYPYPPHIHAQSALIPLSWPPEEAGHVEPPLQLCIVRSIHEYSSLDVRPNHPHVQFALPHTTMRRDGRCHEVANIINMITIAKPIRKPTSWALSDKGRPRIASISRTKGAHRRAVE